MTRIRIALGLALGLALAGPAIGQPTMREAPPVDDAARSSGDRDTTPTADRRPLYVVGGVAVLGAIFLWNRRRRAELDRLSEAGTREARAAARAARAPAPPDDPDAADLRAAANSATSDEEPRP